jgi:hypothetical protein
MKSAVYCSTMSIRPQDDPCIHSPVQFLSTTIFTCNKTAKGTGTPQTRLHPLANHVSIPLPRRRKDISTHNTLTMPSQTHRPHRTPQTLTPNAPTRRNPPHNAPKPPDRNRHPPHPRQHRHHAPLRRRHGRRPAHRIHPPRHDTQPSILDRRFLPLDSRRLRAHVRPAGIHLWTCARASARCCMVDSVDAR